MCLFDVKIDVANVDNTIRAAGTTVKKAAKYRKWTFDDMIYNLLVFYSLPAMSIKTFHRENLQETNIPEKTFGSYWRNSRLKDLQDGNIDLVIAKDKIESFVAKVKKNSSARIALAIQSRRYLTEQEEKGLVHLALTLGKSGMGIDRDELLQIVNEMLNLDLDDREREEATEKTVRCILERHPELMKLVNSGGLDPARARKATKKTRDIVFSKLQAQTRCLYAQGRIPWMDYRDIPSRLIFNMDEVGTDTTKHRRKIIADKRNLFSRIFTVTPEGDRMKGHITGCITTRADGKFFVVKFGSNLCF
jgi:hypothetical protein